uniref:Uncharacterized protein n=1 Tax=Aegilops tauschii subsp. strangulata TaxID=200361 RepID=A0A453CTJ7_AEGTS
MAVDLMGCYTPRRADDQLAIQEAATAGLRSLELLVSSLSGAAPSKAPQQHQQQPFGEIADQAVSKFRKVISILDRTGHSTGRSSAAPTAPSGRRAGQARSLDRRGAGVGGRPGPAAAEPDAGLHQAEPDHVGRDVRDVHVLLLVGDRRRGQRVQGPQPGLRRQAAAVRAQEKALRRRALGGQHHRQPMPLLQEKEEPREDDGEGAGGEREDRRHPAGRVLVEEVRPEAHQRIPLPTGLLQVQHSARVPGAEARGARPGRPGDAGGDLRGRAPPLAGADADADGAVAYADADGRSRSRS